MHDVHEDEHRDQDEEEGPDVVGAPLERRLEGSLHVANVEEVGEDEILAAPESIILPHMDIMFMYHSIIQNCLPILLLRSIRAFWI